MIAQLGAESGRICPVLRLTRDRGVDGKPANGVNYFKIA
jgi:hypothetical protein